MSSTPQRYTFDPETETLLRQMARTVTGRATCDHLRAALEQPPAPDPGPATLHATAELDALLRRAARLAGQRQSASVGRADLRAALAEADALAAGLDLARLRFTRWRLQRLYGPRLNLRLHAAAEEVPRPADRVGHP